MKRRQTLQIADLALKHWECSSPELVQPLFSALQTCEWDSVSRRCSRGQVPHGLSCPARIPGEWHEQSLSCGHRFSGVKLFPVIETSQDSSNKRRMRRRQIRRRYSSRIWMRRWNPDLWMKILKSGCSRNHHRLWGVSWSRNGMCSVWSASASASGVGRQSVGLTPISKEFHCEGTGKAFAECLQKSNVYRSTCCDKYTYQYQHSKPEIMQQYNK